MSLSIFVVMTNKTILNRDLSFVDTAVKSLFNTAVKSFAFL